MKSFTCDICNAPMELIKTIGTKQSGKHYRQRWFKCPIDGYIKKVYADGKRDETIMPFQKVRNNINEAINP